MTTKRKSAKKTTAQTEVLHHFGIQQTDAVLLELPLDSIIVRNYRKIIDPATVKDLSENIDQLGLIEPITVKRHENDTYLLITGQRRLLAVKELRAKYATLNNAEIIYHQHATIRCQVINTNSDRDDLLLQLTENICRENPHPLDEAKAFEVLRDLLPEKERLTTEQIGQLFGYSSSYVLKRIQLLRLIAPLQEYFKAGHFDIAIANQLARCSEEDQRRTLSVYQKKNTLAPYDIKETRIPLDGWPFASSGPCVGCLKRTSCNLTLFDDWTQADKDNNEEPTDECTDRKCFEHQLAGFVNKADTEKKMKKLLRGSYQYAGWIQLEGEEKTRMTELVATPEHDTPVLITNWKKGSENEWRADRYIGQVVYIKNPKAIAETKAEPKPEEPENAALLCYCDLLAQIELPEVALPLTTEELKLITFKKHNFQHTTETWTDSVLANWREKTNTPNLLLTVNNYNDSTLFNFIRMSILNVECHEIIDAYTFTGGTLNDEEDAEAWHILHRSKRVLVNLGLDEKKIAAFLKKWRGPAGEQFTIKTLFPETPAIKQTPSAQ